MTTVYAESSAVLRWLLGASDGPAIQDVLVDAEQVVTSALTGAEVGRTLRRLTATGVLDPEARDAAWLRFCTASARWHQFAVTDDVLHRVAEPFPAEPLRTLDAVHLATAVRFHREVAPLALLTVDEALRRNGEATGLNCVP